MIVIYSQYMLKPAAIWDETGAVVAEFQKEKHVPGLTAYWWIVPGTMSFDD